MRDKLILLWHGYLIHSQHFRHAFFPLHFLALFLTDNHYIWTGPLGKRGDGGCDLHGKEVFLWWSPLVIPWCSHLHILVLFSYEWELRSVFWCSRLHKAGPLLVWYSTLGDLACEWQAYGWVLCSICDLTEPNSHGMQTRFCYFTIILFLYVFYEYWAVTFTLKAMI